MGLSLEHQLIMRTIRPHAKPYCRNKRSSLRPKKTNSVSWKYNEAPNCAITNACSYFSMQNHFIKSSIRERYKQTKHNNSVVNRNANFY